MYPQLRIRLNMQRAAGLAAFLVAFTALTGCSEEPCATEPGDGISFVYRNEASYAVEIRAWLDGEDAGEFRLEPDETSAIDYTCKDRGVESYDLRAGVYRQQTGSLITFETWDDVPCFSWYLTFMEDETVELKQRC